MTKYTPSADMVRQLKSAFTYHIPKDDQQERYTKINDAAKEFAKVIIKCTPTGREQSLSITKLQECRMWANAAIAIGEDAPKIIPTE